MRSSLLALLTLLGAAAYAQVREEIDVQITELEVTVLDRKGKSVAGLTRDDFQVRSGKREIPITNFFVVRNGVIVNDDGSAPGSIAPETSIPTSLVIFIDETRLAPGSRKRALDALKRYVSANVGANTTATLIRYARSFDVRIRPTEKAGYILAELEKIEREPFVNDVPRERERLIRQIEEILNPPMKNIEGASEKAFARGVTGSGDTLNATPRDIFRRIEQYAEHRTAEVDRTLAAIEKAIDVASIFTGRKVLLYVSDGLPQQPGLELFEYWDAASRSSKGFEEGASTPGADSRMDMSQAMRFDRSAEFRRVVQAAQRAGVAIYSFDAGGLRVSEGTGVESMGMQQTMSTMSLTSNLRSGLQYVAGETGGLYIANDNDIDRVLARMSEQFTTYYSIGIRAQKGELDISVKNRPELRVLATRRRPPRTRQERLEQDVRTRLYTRKADNPLRASFQAGTAAKIDGQCMVPVRVAVLQPKVAPEMTPQKVDVHMVLLNENNDESAVQNVAVPFLSGQAVHAMMLRIRPLRHVMSVAVSNPVSGETSFLQGEIDGTTCR